MKKPIICKLPLHNSQIYKIEYYCHRLTKNGLMSIFTHTKWTKTIASRSQDSLGLELKWYGKVAEVEERRSILEQLEHACF